MGPQQINQNRT